MTTEVIFPSCKDMQRTETYRHYHYPPYTTDSGGRGTVRHVLCAVNWAVSCTDVCCTVSGHCNCAVSLICCVRCSIVRCSDVSCVRCCNISCSFSCVCHDVSCGVRCSIVSCYVSCYVSCCAVSCGVGCVRCCTVSCCTSPHCHGRSVRDKFWNLYKNAWFVTTALFQWQNNHVKVSHNDERNSLHILSYVIKYKYRKIQSESNLRSAILHKSISKTWHTWSLWKT